jgi:hypothetical protein
MPAGDIPGIGGGWFQNTLNRIGNATSIGGMFNSLMSFPGAGGVMAAAGLGSAYMSQAMQASQHSWMAQLQQQSAVMSGQWLNPYQASAQMARASASGMHDLMGGGAAGAAWTFGSSLPIFGGAIRNLWESEYGRGITAEGELKAAELERAGRQTQVIGLTGGMSAGSGMGQHLQPLLQLASMMPSTAGAASMFTPETRSWLESKIGAVGPKGEILTHGPFTMQQVAAELSGVQRAGSALGNEDLLERVLNPTTRNYSVDAKRNANEAAEYFAGRGDVFAIQSMLPDIGKKKADELLKEAMYVRGLQISEQYGRAGLSSASAGVEYARGTGAGYMAVAGAIGQTAPQLRQMAEALRSQASASRNPLEAAQLSAQADQVAAQASSVPQQITMTQIGGEMTLFTAGQSQAETGLTRAMYGGGSAADVMGAYGGLGAQASSRAAQFRANATRPGISPEDAQNWLARAASEEAQAGIMIPRQAGQFAIGYGSAQLGVAGAGVAANITQAQLFGGPGAQYEAGMGQVGFIQQQQGFAGWQLANASGLGLSQPEQLQLQRELIDLKKQEVEVTQSVVRSYFSMNTSIASTERGIAGIQQGRAVLTGVGGTAAVPYWQQSVGTAHGEAAAIDAEIANLKGQGVADDNPQLVSLRQRKESALTGVEQARGGLAGTPMPFEFRMQRSAVEFGYQAMTRTYLPWGNQRGALSSLMGMAGEELQTVNEMERKARASGDWQPWMAEQFQQRRIDVGGRMIGYQQQYEQGFMDRLISSTYNAPGSMGFVANRFTQLEAAPFLQAMGPGFGFSTSGARDWYMGRVPRFASSLIGQLQSPEGFVSTAMSGAQPPEDMGALAGRGALGFLGGGGGGASGGEITIHIVIHDPSGKELGRESQRMTIGDMTNGALALTLPMLGMGWAAGGAAHQ